MAARKKAGEKCHGAAADDALSSTAARLRYARESANLEPHALREALRARGIHLTRQLLHRYESVEAQNPNLNLIEGIANVTGFNAGWLLFGAGPVFASDPLVQFARALNLQALKSGKEGKWPTTRVLKSTGVDLHALAAHLANPLAAPLDDSTARALETCINKPVGWLDRISVAEDAPLVDRLDLVDALSLTVGSLALSREQRQALRKLVDSMQPAASI